MVIGSGLAGQIGFAAESVYGTFVTPDHFYEFNSAAIKADRASIVSHGIGLGDRNKTGRHKEYPRWASGPVEFDYLSKLFGLLLKNCLGAYANTLVVGSERKALITPDALGLQGLSLSCQVGIPDVGGTSRPYSFRGGKIKSWELKGATDGQLMLVCDFDFKDHTLATGLASASYPSGAEILVFSEGAVTIGGVTSYVKSFSVKGDNALATDRRFLGNVKKEPIRNAIAAITGNLAFEFEDNTRFSAFIAGTETANLILTFTSPTIIAGGGPVLFKITIPWIVYDGDTPTLGGPGIVQESLPFRALYDGTNAIITLEQRTLDTVA